MIQQADVVIIGAGAAGLMAGIWAGRTSPASRVIILDGARLLGAKILVAGGGRCNVTHFQVSERDFAGSTPNAIRKILRRFDVPQTIDFFRELGVDLKREETGKLFPTTDNARTVLSALLKAADDAGVVIENPRRVETVERDGDGFVIRGEWGEIRARRVILATGGKSLPKTGSDGHGYDIARALGHTTTSRIFPALVPILLPDDHFICALRGLTVPASLEVRSATNKRIIEFTDSTLCTHFGLSGPSVLDISRYFLDARAQDPGAKLLINWLPEQTMETFDEMLLEPGAATCVGRLRALLPDRLAQALCAAAGVEPGADSRALSREKRRQLAATVTQLALPITGDRGFVHAEVTAGGVPLRELQLSTMESRVCAGLHLCGEICDVDGRIGGFNFQWAWASGYVAGTSVVRPPES